MNITKTVFSRIALRTAVGSLPLWLSQTAWAQAAAPAAPAAAPVAAPPATPVAAAPATAEPAPAAAAPAPPAAPPPEPAPAPAPADAAPAAPPPEKKPDELPPIDVGAWVRVGLQIQGDSDPKKLDDQHFNTIYGELHVGGKVHKSVSYTLNLNVNGRGATPGLMDAIIGLDFMDELHLWSGQLLTPVDRTNFSGPFFTSPWSYPGIMGVGGKTVFITPNGEDVYGRDAGTVLWGDVEKGTFKYYLGLTHLANTAESPLVSGRLAFAAIGKEPGYYGSSTYYGDQDILAFGFGAQVQKDGSRFAGTPAVGTTPAVPAASDSYSEVNVDALAEFKLGESGVITGEGAFYHYSGDYNPADNQLFILASYLSPAVGPGKLQPLVRYQMAKKGDVQGVSQDPMSQIDAQLAYVVKGANLRGLLGFSHTDLGHDIVGNAIQLGLQTIMF